MLAPGTLMVAGLAASLACEPRLGALLLWLEARIVMDWPSLIAGICTSISSFKSATTVPRIFWRKNLASCVVRQGSVIALCWR